MCKINLVTAAVLHHNSIILYYTNEDRLLSNPQGLCSYPLKKHLNPLWSSLLNIIYNNTDTRRTDQSGWAGLFILEYEYKIISEWLTSLNSLNVYHWNCDLTVRPIQPRLQSETLQLHLLFYLAKIYHLQHTHTHTTYFPYNSELDRGATAVITEIKDHLQPVFQHQRPPDGSDSHHEQKSTENTRNVIISATDKYQWVKSFDRTGTPLNKEKKHTHNHISHKSFSLCDAKQLFASGLFSGFPKNIFCASLVSSFAIARFQSQYLVQFERKDIPIWV